MDLKDLSAVTWCCVHFAPSADAASELKKHGLAVADVSGEQIRTADELFEELAKALRFPEYFGRNWDALDECLRDMEWMPASGYVLTVNNGTRFWKNAPAVAGALVESWLCAAEAWSHENVPFHLVFVMST